MYDSKGQAVETEKKIYQCRFCFKAFSKPSLLKRHETTHTGERPYKCELCASAFKQKVHLTGHYVKMHSGFTGEARGTKVVIKGKFDDYRYSSLEPPPGGSGLKVPLGRVGPSLEPPQGGGHSSDHPHGSGGSSLGPPEGLRIKEEP